MVNSNVEKYAEEFCGENEKLKEENLKYESEIEKFIRDFHVFDEKIKKLESDVYDKNCQIEEMNHYIDCLKSDLEEARCYRVEFPTEPIKVAEMLIYATYTRENCITGKEYDKPVFENWQLEQIAKHLLVYCGK